MVELFSLTDNFPATMQIGRRALGIVRCRGIPSEIGSRTVREMLMSQTSSLAVEALVKPMGPFIRDFMNAFLDAETTRGITGTSRGKWD